MVICPSFCTPNMLTLSQSMPPLLCQANQWSPRSLLSMEPSKINIPLVRLVLILIFYFFFYFFFGWKLRAQSCFRSASA